MLHHRAWLRQPYVSSSEAYQYARMLRCQEVARRSPRKHCKSSNGSHHHADDCAFPGPFNPSAPHAYVHRHAHAAARLCPVQGKQLTAALMPSSDRCILLGGTLYDVGCHTSTLHVAAAGSRKRMQQSCKHLQPRMGWPSPKPSTSPSML